MIMIFISLGSILAGHGTVGDYICIAVELLLEIAAVIDFLDFDFGRRKRIRKAKAARKKAEKPAPTATDDQQD